MDEKITVAVSTYKKNEALRVCLKTFREFCAFELINNVVIADDNNGEAEPVFKELESQWEGKLTYITGERVGIAKNKNRGLLFFIERTNDTHILLLDDDIQFIGSGLEQRLLKATYGHITGYLGNYNDPASNLPFFQQFPPMGENEYLWFCPGSQGIMLWAWRQVIELVGYYDHDFKGYYGFEHSVWSNRINRAYGMYPDYFPILKYCERYFVTQMIGNNYGPDYLIDKKGKQILRENPFTKQMEPILVNEEHWRKRKEEIYRGIGIYRTENAGVKLDDTKMWPCRKRPEPPVESASVHTVFRGSTNESSADIEEKAS